MRYTAESLSRFMERHVIDRAQLLKIYVLATGYTAPLPMLLRAYVQGRSVAGQMAGRARIVPTRTPRADTRLGDAPLLAA